MAIRAGRGRGLETLAMWLPAVAFLSVFSNPEPERRLAPLLAGWAFGLMIRASPVEPGVSLALSGLSLASGVIGLSLDFVDTVATPLGVFSGPVLMFVRLAFVQARPGLAAAGVLLLGLVIVAAGSRTLEAMRRPRGAELGETGSRAENSDS
jgi:hypothetical protein